MKSTRTILVVAVLGAAVGLVFGQPVADYFSSSEGSGRWVRIEGGQVVNEDELRTARETAPHSSETPDWTNAPGFEADVFTFTRVIFQSDTTRRGGRNNLRWLGWWVDYPDADLNLSYRLQELTSIQTDPDARVLKLTDPGLNDHPLLYMEHAGYMRLSDREVAALRNYLLSGGALFVNDFWGTEEWSGFAAEMRRVMPEQDWVELSLDHPIFRSVFDLPDRREELQVPTMQFWNQQHDPADPRSSLQRIYRGEGSEEVNFRALYDERDRMIVFAIHNSDVSDGWERESENQVFFTRYSEKVAYPLAINVIFYLMSN